ncbi:MAG: WYL domain-containing protein [Ardenticatenales bacterium]|nr:WYL domain-containing protein [Ardenticatenales bacterium]
MPSTASTTLAFRRTLHIIRALQQAPRDQAFLLNLVLQLEGEDAYSKAPGKAFQGDLVRAREQFGVTIYYKSALKTYTIQEINEQGWLDLPDEVLDALVFLYRTFDKEAPHAAQVRYALDMIIGHLPSERAKKVLAQHFDFVLEFRDLDSPIHPEVMEKVRMAFQQRQPIRFHYLSPRNPEQEPRLHEVEPSALHHRDGHWYFVGHDRLGTSPTGEEHKPGERRFRLSCILPNGLQVLPEKLPLHPRQPRPYKLRYWLHPDLARGKVSQRFDKTEIRELDGAWEGWVEVTAEITDEFAAARTLFGYGQKCKVLEPPGVVQWILDALWGMMELYRSEMAGEE